MTALLTALATIALAASVAGRPLIIRLVLLAMALGLWSLAGPTTGRLILVAAIGLAAGAVTKRIGERA